MDLTPEFRLPFTSVQPDQLKQLEALRAELADLAFVLERRGRLDAADITRVILSRLAEWRATWEQGGPRDRFET